MKSVCLCRGRWCGQYVNIIMTTFCQNGDIDLESQPKILATCSLVAGQTLRFAGGYQGGGVGFEDRRVSKNGQTGLTRATYAYCGQVESRFSRMPNRRMAVAPRSWRISSESGRALLK